MVDTKKSIMEFWQNKKVLVTGGAGFIGSSLVKRLVLEGAKVKVIDNLWRGRLDNLKYPDMSSSINIERDFYLADLTDYSKCLELVHDIDLVFHLADVLGGIQFVFNNESFVFRQNVVINSNVLSACITNGVKNYIYVGTACSYPKHLQMESDIIAFREDQTYPAEPESSYGWSKLLGEYEAELARKSSAINVGILRLHNVFGPGLPYEDDRAQVLPSLIRKAINYPKEPFVVWGSGNQYRDFVYIDDIINALMLVASQGMNLGVIQIGSEKATSLNKAAELIVEISDKPINIIYDRNKPEGDHGRIAICDRARDILNWKATTNFEDGLQKTYEWINNEMRKKGSDDNC